MRAEDALIASRDVAALEQLIGKAPLVPARDLRESAVKLARPQRLHARPPDEVFSEGVQLLRRAS